VAPFLLPVSIRHIQPPVSPRQVRLYPIPAAALLMPRRGKPESYPGYSTASEDGELQIADFSNSETIEQQEFLIMVNNAALVCQDIATVIGILKNSVAGRAR
jgi:hypothetical protein